MSTELKYFDHPFYTLQPPPPLGVLDPCYLSWIEVIRMAWERASICHCYGEQSKACMDARERYFEAARQYAFCLDDAWGQNEF